MDNSTETIPVLGGLQTIHDKSGAEQSVLS